MGHRQRRPEPIAALEFLVNGNETTLVADTIRATAGEALERLTIAPLDGTPRYKLIVAVRSGLMPAVIKAVMNALEKSG